MTQLTHFDEQGASRMVDVGNKEITDRVAVAHAKVIMKPETFQRVMDKNTQGRCVRSSKSSWDYGGKTDLCFDPDVSSLNLTSVKIDYTNNSVNEIEIFSEVRVTGKTGVEMEAITAAAVCAITIYDMCKAIDKGMIISDIHLMKKSGGKSGAFVRQRFLTVFYYGENNPA